MDLNKNYKIFIVSRKKLRSKNKNIEYIQHDLTKGVIHKIKEIEIDFIIHLAGKTYSVDSSNREYIEKNFITTLNLLKSINKKIEKLIFISSQYVYGNNNSTNLLEKTRLDAKHSFYGKSKINCEKIIKKYSKKIEKIIILRSCGFIEGGGIIDYIQKQIKANKEILLYRNGKVVRDYISVNDIIDLILIILKKKIIKPITTINVGSKNLINTKKIVFIISKILNKKFKLILSDKKIGLPNTKLNIKLAKKMFNYNPKSFNHNLKVYLKKL